MTTPSGRSKALAAAVAAIFATPSVTATAMTHFIENCNDDGTGSLRSMINSLTAANSGDTIDLSGLPCATISLSTGALAIPIDDLTITGSGEKSLNITREAGSGKQRIFKHTGGGTLTLSYMTISNGYYGGAAINIAGGGCISAPSLKLDHAKVTDCKVVGSTGALGGGVAAGYLVMRRSTIINNHATVLGTASGEYASGGGAWVSLGFDISASGISGNEAVGNLYCKGGGLGGGGSVAKLMFSTIAANHSDGFGGGIFTSAYPITIGNSTISGNDANFVGGIYLQQTPGTITNTTIAFNGASFGAAIVGGEFHYLAAGLYVLGRTVDLESSLLANNHYGTPPLDNDLSIRKLDSSDAVTGFNNLVRESHGDAPPASKAGACPLLAALRDNGGPTQTHALRSGSPGIDAGNDVAQFGFDQRQSSYQRQNGVADIGAYEIQAEEVFSAGFNGCVDLP